MSTGLDLLNVRAIELLEKVTHGVDDRVASAGACDGRGEGAAGMEDGVSNKTPQCALCGADEIPPVSPAYVALQGQWMYSKEHRQAIFVLDPNTDLGVIKLANGQLALAIAESAPTVHCEAKCLQQILGWAPEMFAEEYFHDHECRPNE